VVKFTKMEQISKRYKNPPIQEAVCEFRFDLEHNPEQIQIEKYLTKLKVDSQLLKRGIFTKFRLKLILKKTKKI